jgi:ribosomal L7/L12-like protein
VVVRVDDEYDVIHLGLRKESVGQSLIQEEEKCYDLFRLEDGSELWFDITDAFRMSQEPGNAVYRVRLEHVGSSRLKVLALIREIWGLTPAEAKSWVDSSRPILGKIESKHWKDVQKKFWDVGAVLDFE